MSDRRFQRFIKRANRDFGGADCCHGCGRDLIDHEFTVVGRVRQGAPGERLRVPLTLADQRHDDLPEAGAWALFELITERDGIGITGAEFLARWQQLAAGGSA
jgi:hypothetical protein